jgi:hypothetical protein
MTVEGVGEMEEFFSYLSAYVMLAVGVSKPGQESL